MEKYKSNIQQKNIAWYLPRPNKDKYKGGMPLYCEDWLIQLAKDLLNNQAPKILNLFCGMNKQGVRVDLNPEVNPSYICDVHELSRKLNVRFKYDIILADPPYSNEESKQLYNTGELNYRKWTSEADLFLKRGGLFIIYHKLVVPNPNPEKYFIEKRVFIGNRTWHLPRIAIYFKKK